MMCFALAVTCFLSGIAIGGIAMWMSRNLT